MNSHAEPCKSQTRAHICRPTSLFRNWRIPLRLAFSRLANEPIGCWKTKGQGAAAPQENLRLQSEFSRRSSPFFMAESREKDACGSGKNFSARERALAAPLIIFAQLGLVFFHLPYQLAEGFLATGSHSGARAGGVQRCGGQR